MLYWSQVTSGSLAVYLSRDQEVWLETGEFYTGMRGNRAGYSIFSGFLLRHHWPSQPFSWLKRFHSDAPNINRCEKQRRPFLHTEPFNPCACRLLLFVCSLTFNSQLIKGGLCKTDCWLSLFQAIKYIHNLTIRKQRQFFLIIVKVFAHGRTLGLCTVSWFLKSVVRNLLMLHEEKFSCLLSCYQTMLYWSTEGRDETQNPTNPN